VPVTYDYGSYLNGGFLTLNTIKGNVIRFYVQNLVESGPVGDSDVSHEKIGGLKSKMTTNCVSLVYMTGNGLMKGEGA